MCSDLVYIYFILLGLIIMEPVFSLEDDYGDMFLTQSDNVITESDSGKSEILPDPMDFSSPCVSLVLSQDTTHYSDISDDDLFEIPVSQKHQNEPKVGERYVN